MHHSMLGVKWVNNLVSKVSSFSFYSLNTVKNLMIKWISLSQALPLLFALAVHVLHVLCQGKICYTNDNFSSVILNVVS